MQAFYKGPINVAALFCRLHEAGYPGTLAIELIRQAFTNDSPDDIIGETVLMRDCCRDWAAALPPIS